MPDEIDKPLDPPAEPEKPVEAGMPAAPAAEPESALPRSEEPLNPVETEKPLAAPDTDEAAAQLNQLNTLQGKLESAHRLFSKLKRGGVEPAEIDAALKDLEDSHLMVEQSIGNIRGIQVVKPSPMGPNVVPQPSAGSQSAAAQGPTGAPTPNATATPGPTVVDPRKP